MNPEILVRRGVEPALVGTILISALIHASVVALLITVPGRFLSTPQKPQSYTVDLVAPDVLGGTNLIPGGGKAKEPAGPPAPPVVEPKPAPPAPVAKPAEPAPVVAPPEPPPAPKAA